MRCDFHVHTFYSFDSNASPREMVLAAKRKGIDCLAITDHNEIKGAIEAIEIGKKEGILVIPGIEIKTKEGEIIALCLREKIKAGLSARETLKEIKQKGGFSILVHPFAFLKGFKLKDDSFFKEIDAIEVLNGSNFKIANKKAFYLAKKYNLPFVAGSDAHFPDFVGKVWIEIEGKNLCLKEIFKKIREKKGILGGKEAGIFEKLIDHSKRAIVKISRYVTREKRKI